MTKRYIIDAGKITRSNQLTIPKRVREEFDLNEGDQVFFIMEIDEKGEKKLVLTKGPIALE